MKVLGHTKSAPLIKEMLEHETEHLKKFEELLVQYDVRPTVLVPLWRLTGFTLGAGCSLLGIKELINLHVMFYRYSIVAFVN